MSFSVDERCTSDYAEIGLTISARLLTAKLKSMWVRSITWPVAFAVEMELLVGAQDFCSIYIRAYGLNLDLAWLWFMICLKLIGEVNLASDAVSCNMCGFVSIVRDENLSYRSLCTILCDIHVTEFNKKFQPDVAVQKSPNRDIVLEIILLYGME